MVQNMPSGKNLKLQGESRNNHPLCISEDPPGLTSGMPFFITCHSRLALDRIPDCKLRPHEPNFFRILEVWRPVSQMMIKSMSKSTVVSSLKKMGCELGENFKNVKTSNAFCNYNANKTIQKRKWDDRAYQNIFQKPFFQKENTNKKTTSILLHKIKLFGTKWNFQGEDTIVTQIHLDWFDLDAFGIFRIYEEFQQFQGWWLIHHVVGKIHFTSAFVLGAQCRFFSEKVVIKVDVLRCWDDVLVKMVSTRIVV